MTLPNVEVLVSAKWLVPVVPEALVLADLSNSDRISSLEKGKLADIIAVDFSTTNFQPMHNPVSQLIYAATGHQFSHTWINGKLLYKDGEFKALDEARPRVNTQQWQEKIGTFS